MVERAKDNIEKFDINDIQDDVQSLSITKKLIDVAISQLNNNKEFINTYPSNNTLLSEKNQNACSKFLNQFSSDDVPLEEMLGVLQEWIEHHQQGLKLLPADVTYSEHSAEDLRKIRVQNTKNIDELIQFLNKTLTDEPLLTELRNTLKTELGFDSSNRNSRV